MPYHCLHSPADTANKAAASFETFMKTFISDIDPNQFDNSKRMPLVPVKHAALPQPCPRAKGSEQIFHSCADLALQLGVLSDCGSCGTKFCNKYSSTLASSPTAVHYVTPSVAALVDFKRDIMASLVDGKCVAFSGPATCLYFDFLLIHVHFLSRVIFIIVYGSNGPQQHI
tara:strand:- start:35 stop:547 length:513 start_codon:yes stop_codon:yes gene_type:complete